MKKIVAIILILCLSITLCASTSKADLYRLSMGKYSDSIEIKPTFLSVMFDTSTDKLKKDDFSDSSCAITAALMYADALISAKDDADVELDGYIYFAEKKKKETTDLFL